MSSLIHWHEGQFLQPQHFQHMQRELHEFHAQERTLARAYPYGVVSMRFSEDELANRTLRLESLKVVMPSGLVIDFPDNAVIPSMDLRESLARHPDGFIIYLAAPLWDSNRANTLESGYRGEQTKLLYLRHERELRDENTGDSPKPIVKRKINSRLVLKEDDTNEMEVLPLMRILPGVGQTVGQARLDPDFAPPCYNIRASAAIRGFAIDLANQVVACRNSLASQVYGAKLNMETIRGAQIEMLLRLRTLNRFAARLPLMVESNHLAPVDLYIELHELLGELNTLSPEEDIFSVRPFNHDDPLPAFQQLSERIRDFLKDSVEESYIKLSFEKLDICFQAHLEDEHLSGPSEYFLAIQTRMDSRELTALVEDPDRFKFMTLKLLNRPIFGIRLKEERVPPLELPQQSGLHYFRVLRSESGRMWDMLVRERAAAIRWNGMENTDFEMTLYMMLPKG